MPLYYKGACCRASFQFYYKYSFTAHLVCLGESQENNLNPFKDLRLLLAVHFVLYYLGLIL